MSHITHSNAQRDESGQGLPCLAYPTLALPYRTLTKKGSQAGEKGLGCGKHMTTFPCATLSAMAGCQLLIHQIKFLMPVLTLMHPTLSENVCGMAQQRKVAQLCIMLRGCTKCTLWCVCGCHERTQGLLTFGSNSLAFCFKELCRLC